MHICREKYRLELHWDQIRERSSSVIELLGAKFSGPALDDALKLQTPDTIDLDFTPQLLTVMNSYYIVKLSWTSCEYISSGEIKLIGVTLSNDFLKTLNKFEDGDYIVINTEKHEEATHAFHLVYDSSVVKENGVKYNYRDK